MPHVILFGWFSLFTTDPLDSNTAIFTLVNAERQFSRMSVAEGMRDAFVKNFRDDAVIFVNGPINGKEFYEKQEPEPVLLTWEPEFADISIGGDFGYTTGPWEMKDYGPDRLPSAYGYYVSVWKRSADGHWGVALDCGIRTPGRADSVAAVHVFREPSVFSSTPRKERDELWLAGASSADAYRKDRTATSYTAAFHPDALLFRSGHFPMKSQSEIRTYLESHLPAWTWTTEKAEVADAGDLGFTYGPYQNSHDEKDHGHLIRVWKKLNGIWKVVIDVTMPARRPAANE